MTAYPAFDAVLFDLDGVLIHSEPVSERAMQAAARRFGFEVPDEAMPMFTGLPGHVVCAMAVDRFADGKVDALTFRAVGDEIYEGWLPDVPAMPGAEDLVRALAAAGKRLALVTSSRRRQAETALAVHGLRALFDVVVGSEDVQRTKPDPEPYRTAAGQLGVDPTCCVVIEDSLAGCRSGLAAGCHVVGYPSSFAAEALLDAGAHVVCTTHPEIGRHLLG